MPTDFLGNELHVGDEVVFLMSNAKYPKEHSKKKHCVCGGHNHSNPKKNKHHNSTMVRLRIRAERKRREVII